MFVYSFFSYAGSDRVFLLHDSPGVRTGDLLRTSDDILLVLGDDISFVEQYTLPYKRFVLLDTIPAFFTQQSIDLVHQLVALYYTTYTNVIDLFIRDIDVLLRVYRADHEDPSYVPVIFDHRTQGFVEKLPAVSGQQLVVFPDLWSMYQALGSDYKGNTIVWHSGMTALQQARIATGIRQGSIDTLYTTHAGIFQPRMNLQRIVFFEPYKRYYASMQDPRYKTADVLSLLVSLYDGCQIESIQHI